MITAQITVIAENEEQLNERLKQITSQIEDGYSGASGKKGGTSFKYLVKETAAGSQLLLPRISPAELGETAPAAAATSPEEEEEEQEQDQAGTAPIPSASLPLAQ